MNQKFFIGFGLAVLGVVTLNLLAAHVQSDCGIRAVIGLWIPSMRFCSDDIVRVGFPFRVIEEGGVAFRSMFDSSALTADIVVALAASLAVGWITRQVWK